MQDNFDFEDIDSILAQFKDFSADDESVPSANGDYSYLPPVEEQTDKPEEYEYFDNRESDEDEEYDESENYEEINSEIERRREKIRNTYTNDKTEIFRPSGKNSETYRDYYERSVRYEEYDNEEYDDVSQADDFEEEDEYVYRSKKKRDSIGKRILLGFAGLIFAVISIVVLAWVGVKIHPDSSTSSSVRGNSRANIFTQLGTYSNNSKGEVLGNLAYIRKVYSIPEGDLSAPVPHEASYGAIPYSNPSAVLELIQKAKDSGLIGENETVAFNPNAEFFADDRNIQYYYDDTILVIAWKELIENRICSFVEVKVGDASQFRRKLANDSFQTAVQINCSDLAAASNAVVAMNADFFAFRDYGICVYQRQVYRTNPRMVDTCYITAAGDMIYSRSGELATPEEAQAFVNANNVLFSIAFGPVLIDNGEVQYCPTYPMGEPDLEYSRAGIGQIDKLHYLYMTVNHTWPDREIHPRCNVNEFAQLFATKPVFTAYNLDGGQTSEINIRGQMFNRVDWGEERPVSDIIYFATALPESEVAG